MRMTIRDLRQRWPEAERKLATVGEIIITRDSKPVARLLPYREPRRRKRDRFDLDEHMRWLRRFWKGKRVGPSTDVLLRRERADD